MSGTRFVLREGHLKLARAMNVRWCGDEAGAPMVDPKRPYGNSGFGVLRDVAKAVGLPEPDYDDGKLEGQLWNWHDSMGVAVRIILAHAGEAVPLGVYERENAWSPWRYAGPEEMV